MGNNWFVITSCFGQSRNRMTPTGPVCAQNGCTILRACLPCLRQASSINVHDGPQTTAERAQAPPPTGYKAHDCNHQADNGKFNFAGTYEGHQETDESPRRPGSSQCSFSLGCDPGSKAARRSVNKRSDCSSSSRWEIPPELDATGLPRCYGLHLQQRIRSDVEIQ